MTERKAMITTRPRLPVTRQCQLLAVPRSNVYARSQPVSTADLTVMCVLDEVYLKWPFYGSRRLCDVLQQRGHRVNRKRVQRLMRQMGLRAIYPKPRT
ncbi:MAG: IS3 family transposase, partial [Nitrospirota bacterium]|nr:IS3 family transposase [Nitrospirota bacterium]